MTLKNTMKKTIRLINSTAKIWIISPKHVIILPQKNERELNKKWQNH